MSTATKGRFRYGTSSWSEKSWIGPFYPPGTKPADVLACYATQFGTVEADTTYYRVPAKEMIRGWRAKTPSEFVLAPKFPRSVVHGGEDAKPDGRRVLAWPSVAKDVEAFLDAMGELGKKCGPLVVQLPYFNRTAFAGLDPFLERLERFLEELPAGFRYGVEVRNKSWIGEELLEGLLSRVREVYAYANNHYAGFGPATIRELARKLVAE